MTDGTLSGESISTKLPTEGADLLTLAGVADGNLSELQRLFPVRVTLRGEQMTITGTADAVEKAAAVAQRMIDHAKQRQPLDPDDVLRFSMEGPARDSGTPGRIVLPGVRKIIQPKTNGQAEYMQQMLDNEIVVGIGPAGTGKTYLAVAAAVDALARKRVKRIVLARPAVEAGESLGFLPGDMQAKVDPYLRPLYDALDDLMPPSAWRARSRRASSRSRRWHICAVARSADAFVILDEAQNATNAQMKMFLTRLGLNSRAVITGDKTQIDLPKREESGLLQVERILQNIDGIAFHYFTRRTWCATVSCARS
jgi:phosphate starvation-inducible protein PhoH and related proteins